MDRWPEIGASRVLELPLMELSAGISALLCMSSSDLAYGIVEIDWFAHKLREDLNNLRDQVDEVFNSAGMKPLSR